VVEVTTAAVVIEVSGVTADVAGAAVVPTVLALGADPPQAAKTVSRTQVVGIRQ
jgi:hypothetical protein